MGNILKKVLSMAVIILKLTYLLFILINFRESYFFRLEKGNLIFLIIELIFDAYVIGILVLSLIKYHNAKLQKISQIGFVILTIYFWVSGINALDHESTREMIVTLATYASFFFPLFFMHFNYSFLRFRRNKKIASA